MSARTWMVAVAGTAVLFAGCGGDDGDDDEPAATATGPPAAKEPLAAAAKRLERTLARPTCKRLAPFMLHSAPRASEPDTPPTARDCRYIRNEVRNELRGFEVTRAQQFGPGGVSEGTGPTTRPGETVATIWALDRDGSWKAVFSARLRPQIGLRHEYGTASEANARRFVAAVAAANCDDFWRLLNVSSRFVRAPGGDKGRFCRRLPYRDPRSAYAQVKADPDAKLRELGKTRDLGFYGLQLENGRYLVLVLSGRIGGVAESEQKDHDNPTVLEFLTLRRPGE